MQDSSFVTIIMPIRNEADFIEQAIKSVLDNDYPAERMEILVVDGMSNDGTREIVARLSKADSRVMMLDNPKRIAPSHQRPLTWREEAQHRHPGVGGYPSP